MKSNVICLFVSEIDMSVTYHSKDSYIVEVMSLMPVACVHPFPPLPLQGFLGEFRLHDFEAVVNKLITVSQVSECFFDLLKLESPKVLQSSSIIYTHLQN